VVGYLIFSIKRLKPKGPFETAFLKRYGRPLQELEKIDVSEMIFKNKLIFLYRQYCPEIGKIDFKTWSTFASKLFLQIHVNFQKLRKKRNLFLPKCPEIADLFKELVCNAQEKVSGLEDVSTVPFSATMTSKLKPKDFDELYVRIEEFSSEYINKHKNVGAALVSANNIIAEMISFMISDHCQRLKRWETAADLQSAIREQWAKLLPGTLETIEKIEKMGGIKN